MKAKQIFDQLVEHAWYWLLFSSNRPHDYERKAKEVGKLVTSLPADKREQLKNLKSDDVAQKQWIGYDTRPKQPVKRKRSRVVKLKD